MSRLSSTTFIVAVGLALSGCPQYGLRGLRATPDIQCFVPGGSKTVECSSVDFGSVQIDSIATRTVRLVNLGNAALTVATTGWTSDSDQQFTDQWTIKSVAANGNGSFVVSFSPTHVGPATGTFFVESPAGTKTRVQLGVTGTGVGAAVAHVDSQTVDFGNVLQGTTATKTIQLSNTGNVALSLLSGTISGSSTIALQTVNAASVDPSGSVAVTFTYSPTGPETDSATAILTTQSPGAAVQPLSIALTGRSQPTMTVTPTTLSFDDESSGSMTTKPVTITNDGKADLQITSALLGSGTSSYFAAAPSVTEPSTLHPGESETVDVTYNTIGKPDMAADSGSLVVAGSDPLTPSATVTLAGTCPSCMAIDPGCNATYPRRLWPSGADISTCTEGGPTLNTTGAGAENFLNYAGCGVRRDFTTTVGTPIQINSWGDGCACGGCVLWHIDYTLQEDTGSGFQTKHTTQAQDSVQCPGTGGTSDSTVYAPLTTTVRMTAQYDTTGEGYYFTACTQ